MGRSEDAEPESEREALERDHYESQGKQPPPYGRKDIRWDDAELVAKMQRVDEELAKGIFSPDDDDIRAMREAPDGAEGEHAPRSVGPDQMIRPGTRAATDEEVAALFGGMESAGYLQAKLVAERSDVYADGAMTSANMLHAQSIGVALVVDDAGHTGIGVVSVLEDGGKVVRALDPYQAIKLVNALSQAVIAAIDSQENYPGSGS